MLVYSVHMSTGYTNIPASRIAALHRTGEVLFHAREIATLWGITEMNTLYTTLKRYCRDGVLFRVHKGLYSLVALAKLEPMAVGLKALHQFGYVSAETILFREGIISQWPAVITLVSAKSLRFVVGKNCYRSRRLKNDFLFQSDGVVVKNGINMATLERAVADMLYFNPQFHFDLPKSINWKKVKWLQKKVGYDVNA
jgi:predicted transcriptional regulator of viral defense system